MNSELLESLAQVVKLSHEEVLTRLIGELDAESATPRSIQIWAVELPQKAQREALGALVNCWIRNGGETSKTLSTALRALSFAASRNTQAELCWSGPTDSLQGFRSTSAAYNELISSARQEAFLLTFSVGEVELLRASLESALSRGVRLTIVAEDFDVFKQSSMRDRIDLFGSVICGQARLFSWPISKRRQTDGRVFGSMHVKALIVDREVLLLTSANWSSAAMNDNMELGAVIRDRETVSSVVRHFEHLISAGILVPLSS